MKPQEMLEAMQSNDPMGFLASRYGNTPAYQKAMQIMSEKNPQQLEQVVLNLAQQKGVNLLQLRQMANMLGLKL